jgi:hypothetical protein
LISRSNSARLPWSSVAASLTLAETCFSSVRTFVEAGVLDLWKRVMMSLVLRCVG